MKSRTTPSGDSGRAGEESCGSVVAEREHEKGTDSHPVLPNPTETVLKPVRYVLFLALTDRAALLWCVQEKDAVMQEYLSLKEANKQLKQQADPSLSLSSLL
jgi:hypothetical protein